MAQRLRGAARLWVVMLVAACASSQQSADDDPPPPTPLPTAGLAGQKVAVYPLTMVLTEEGLEWDSLVKPRSEALKSADSIIGTLLTARQPEVDWVLPDELRRAHRRAPGMLPDPDQMGTSLLRRVSGGNIPDPLRSQLRTLTGVAADRWAFIPASLFFYAEEEGGGRAELTVVLADVRLGTVGFWTVAEGNAADPWAALSAALRTLSPGLP